MNLEEKLKRLRMEREARSRGPASSVENTWSRLQREAGLSTKEKLEQLIRLTGGTAGPRPKKSVPREPEPRPPLQVFENAYPPDARYGKLRISDALAVGGEVLRYLSRDEAFRDLDLSTTVFLDLETTGLAGERGRCRFSSVSAISGEGRLSSLSIFSATRARKSGCSRSCPGCSPRDASKSVLTYNGKAFDLPLLETRFILQRKSFSLAGLPHLDFLFAARTLWKHKHESCRLFHLAQQVIEAPRDEDIPRGRDPVPVFRLPADRGFRADRAHPLPQPGGHPLAPGTGHLRGAAFFRGGSRR